MAEGFQWIRFLLTTALWVTPTRIQYQIYLPIYLIGSLRHAQEYSTYVYKTAASIMVEETAMWPPGKPRASEDFRQIFHLRRKKKQVWTGLQVLATALVSDSRVIALFVEVVFKYTVALFNYNYNHLVHNAPLAVWTTTNSRNQSGPERERTAVGRPYSKTAVVWCSGFGFSARWNFFHQRRILFFVNWEFDRGFKSNASPVSQTMWRCTTKLIIKWDFE